MKRTAPAPVLVTKFNNGAPVATEKVECIPIATRCYQVGELRVTHRDDGQRAVEQIDFKKKVKLT